MRFQLAVMCALAAPSAPALAQSEPGGSFDLGQILIKGDPPQARGIGPSSVDLEAMETFNRNTLDDAAALIPGVAASNSGGSRNERLLFVRGFDRFQVPLSIDGIRVYLPADGRLDYGRFLTPDLAEIQVAKGYASVLDGPGAMGGAVNLVTRKPVSEFEAEARGVLNLDGDADYAGYNAFALLGTRQDRWYAQASFTRNEQDHWDLPGGFAPVAGEDGGERDFARTKDWRMNAKLGFMPNATDEYSINYTRQEGSKNAPLSTTDPVSIQRNWAWPYWNIDSAYFLSRTALSDEVTLKTRLYRNGFNNLLSAFDDATQTTQTRPRAFNSYYEDVAWGGSAELAVAATPADTIRLALHYRSDKHVEFQQSFPSGTTEPRQTNEEDTWSLAAEYVRAITPALTATLGASYDWRNLKRAEEFGVPPGGGTAVIFSYPVEDAHAWNGQGRLDWTPAEGATFYASFSSRARFPTIFERFSSRFGGAVSNPGLEAERAANFEIGASVRRGAASFAGAVFYSDISNAIVAFPFIYQGQAVTQSRNVGSGENYGIETSFDVVLGPVIIGANYTWTQRHLNDPGNSAFEPSGVPAHKAFVYADWEAVPGLHIVPSLDIASDRWTVNSAGTNYYRTGSYVDAGLRVDYEIDESVTIGAGVRNAFDDLYYLTDGFPEPGRRFFLTARLRR